MSKGVSKTANEALTCKQAAFGYGEEYVSRKTPLLNRVYRTRGLIMHKLVSAAINELKKLHEMCDVQLVILGGGLDTSYDLYRSKVFVVDFEDIINKRKASYQSPLPAHVQLIAGDLCHTEEIKTCLLQSGLHFSAPTVILVECVLGYVDHDSCDRLLQMLANELLNSFIVLYDPVLPHGNPEIDGFAQLMYDKFSERGAPLLSCARTVEEYGDRLTSAGWAHVLTASVNEAQLLFLNKEERTKVSTVEPFDEFASLALLQNCYAVCVASTHAANFGQLMSTLLAVGCGAPRAAGGEEGSQDVDVAQRLRRLEIRAALAERRLTCLEERRRTRTHRTQCHNRTAQANGRLNTSIRAATLQDTNTLVQVYQSALLEPSQQYKSVLKYVKMSSKALKQIDKTYPPEQGSVLFVAEAATGSAAVDPDLGSEGAAISKKQHPQLIGCIGVKLKRDSSGEELTAAVAEVSHFCVAPTSQGQGVGKALLQRAMEHCQEKLGRKYSVCLTVLKDLEAARSLYAAAGFQLINTEQLGADCEICYMRKEIE